MLRVYRLHQHLWGYDHTKLKDGLKSVTRYNRTGAGRLDMNYFPIEILKIFSLNQSLTPVLVWDRRSPWLTSLLVAIITPAGSS